MKREKQDMERAKGKLKKRQAGQKVERKDLNKEIQQMERNLVLRHAAEIELCRERTAERNLSGTTGPDSDEMMMGDDSDL